MIRLPLSQIALETATKALKRIEKGSKFFKPSITNSIGCKIACKAKNKGKKGRVKCSITGSKNEYYINLLALIADDRKDDISKIEEDGFQASHLCHQSACFNSSHLVVESKESNLERNKCINWTWLVCPCGCSHQFNPCNHTPQCILPKSAN